MISSDIFYVWHQEQECGDRRAVIISNEADARPRGGNQEQRNRDDWRAVTKNRELKARPMVGNKRLECRDDR